MSDNLFLVLILFISFSAKSYQQQDVYFLLEQGEHVASFQEAAAFKKKCESKKDSVSCYDYAVHLAQTVDDEVKAVPYYQLGCDLKYETACFNLGGILIKKVETRSKGVEAFQKSCLASQGTKVSKQKKDVLKVACDLVPIIEKHMSAPYIELYGYLKAANPPPHLGKEGNLVQQKSKHGSEALKEMNISLDKRLVSLKKSDLKEFKAEMALQKRFNESVKNFCSYYEKECKGSVCSMCIDGCYSAFYFYRKGQVEEINTSNLAIDSKSVSKTVARKYFGFFAEGICQMPESIWSKSTRPSQCSDAILTDIQSKVVVTMTASDENEGDVCAQLSN